MKSSSYARRMRFLVLVTALLLSACATRPEPTPVPAKTVDRIPAAADRHDHRTLNGMTANQLIEHFGRPRLQVIEGDGTKLQFAGTSCIIDFYLYPGAGGVPRVSHIDARNFQGNDVNVQNCVYAIEGR